jgi:hypothetical protein
MKRRLGIVRKKNKGRRPGMTAEREATAHRLLKLQIEYGAGRKSFERAVRAVFPNDEFHSAYQRAAKMVSDLKRSQKNLGRK